MQKSTDFSEPSGPYEEPDVQLTPREMEVLTLISEGNPSQAVADKLFISKRTVDFHLGNIYAKLGVNSRVQAFREAVRLGLLR